MTHLLWAAIILGIRAGIAGAGFLLGMVVALLPHLLRLIGWAASEGIRIYSRHHLEISPARTFLTLAAGQLGICIGLGVIIWLVGLPMEGTITALLGGVLWLTAIELTDLRHRHSEEALYQDECD